MTTASVRLPASGGVGGSGEKLGRRTTAAVACTAAVAGVLLGGGHHKIQLAAVGALLMVSVLIVVKERERTLLAVTVVALIGVLHKKLGAVELVSSGPPTLYVSTVDVLVFGLYGFWYWSGTLGADLRRSLRRPVMWLPLAALAFELPNLVVGSDVKLELAEIQRSVMAYLLYVYVANRVRRLNDVWLTLAAVSVAGVLEALAVAGQYVTHGTLGLSFFGTPAALGQRVTDAGIVDRPFGTIIHPDFMAAFMAPIALLALAGAICLRGRLTKGLCLVLAGASAVPIALAHARAAGLGLAVGTVIVVALTLATRRLRPVVLMGWLSAAAVGAILGWSQLMTLWHENYHTQHFSLELQARSQLAQVAWHMIHKAPLLGVGLNNFQHVMGSYATGDLIFNGNPVQNFYLLQWSETGVVGLVAIPLIGLALAITAWRLVRSPNRVFASLGIAWIGILVFLAVEEYFGFSIRQENPRSLFWLLAGLLVACSRLAGNEVTGTARPVRVPGPRPRRAPVAATAVSGPAVRSARRLTTWWRTTRAHRRVPAMAGPPVPAAAPVSRAATVGPRLRGSWLFRSFREHPLTRAQIIWMIIGLLAGTMLLVLPAVYAAPRPATSGLELLLSLRDRVTQHTALFTATGDGQHLTQVTPNDGQTYSWGGWAFGGHKIVYTGRRGPEGSPEQIYIANADGSGRRQLTDQPWRDAEPRVSPDGQHLIFIAAWNQFPKYAVYSLDLRTLQVSNLSAVGLPSGAADTDPRYADHGRRIVFINTLSASTDGSTGQHRSLVPGQVYTMSSNGTNRVAVTHDRYYNTDPDVSPNGRLAVSASYRGKGKPQDTTTLNSTKAKLHGFILSTHDVGTGAEVRVFNQGKDCGKRPDTSPCGPLDGPAYIPRFTPDGSEIGYESILSNHRTCLCVVDTNGTNPRVLVPLTNWELQYFDWTTVQPLTAAQSAAMAAIGTAVPSSRLLIAGHDLQGKPLLMVSKPDEWSWLNLPVPAGLVPTDARWGGNRTSVVFTADRRPPAHVTPGPRPPKGQYRHRHYTLNSIAQLLFPALARAAVDRQQVYTMSGAGTGVRQLTNPGTEDYMDAIPDGEWRGNAEPDVSPNHKYVVVSNLARESAESFLLRINLRTGRVYNLTNATAGAMPTSDFNPKFSPDSRSVAFATTTGDSSQIATVSATDGRHFRQLTNDNHLNIEPTWSPDGRYVAFASFRGKPATTSVTTSARVAAARTASSGWYLVRYDTRTGRQKVLTSGGGNALFDPVYSPDGSSIDMIGATKGAGGTDLWQVPANGGTAHFVQVTLGTRETSVDWR